MKARDLHRRIQAYWERPGTLSIIDKNLHELEIRAVLRHLKPGDRIADIGCGDGVAGVRYGAKVRSCLLVERSARLRRLAARRAARAGRKNTVARAGDMLDLDIPGGNDAIVTQRLLINLCSWAEQKRAIDSIRRSLRPGGRYIMVENTNDAFRAMNRWRARVGLAPVPLHWHNRFFDHDKLMRFMRGRFRLVRSYDFGLYYLLTRVYAPMFASFTGWGAGAKKDPIYEKSDRAARLLFEEFRDEVRVVAPRAFGPIQVLVWQRIR